MHFTIIDIKTNTVIPVDNLFTESAAIAEAKKIAKRLKTQCQVLKSKVVHTTGEQEQEFPF
jgi:hypothetical protein